MAANPTESRRIPKLCLHKATGRAVVRLSGQDVYCGKFGTAEAKAQYDKLVIEWLNMKVTRNGTCTGAVGNGTFQAWLFEPSHATSPGVIAENHAVTDRDWSTATMKQLCDLANQFGAEYDGWEASMVRQGKPN